MGKKCMIDVNSEEEFNQIIKQSGMAVQMIRSDDCPHCRDLHPLIEKRCKDIEGFIPVIDCPITKPFCHKQIKNYNKKGIPLVVGTQKGKPVFIVEGAVPDQVNKNFDIMVKMKESAIKQQQQQSGQGNEERIEDSPVMAPVIDQAVENDMIKALVNFGAPSRQMRKPVQLCTPGFDCSNEEYNDRNIQFLLSRSSKRAPHTL